MLKHIGKHSDRKVAIVFREVPNEEHMCLIVYPETLPINVHDSVMRVIESDVGQQAENLGDALFRSLLPDGRPILQTLHTEGMIKKVQTSQIVVTPNASSHVRLDEMNSILREMKQGEAAIKKLAQLDQDKGITGKARRRDDFGREVGAGSNLQRGAQVAGSDAAKALDDASLANDLKLQAQRMAAEAKGLLAESDRLIREATALTGGAAPEARPARRRARSSKNASA